MSLQDHIIKAMSLQQVTCLTLLHLFAAFDTIDHSILLKRLSPWFGITSNTLSWIKSYLLNRPFSVNIEGSKSSSYLSQLPTNSFMVFLKDLFLVLYNSFYILLLSVKSYLIHLQVINSTLMTLNFIYHSRLLTFHTMLLILSKLYLMSIIGCHLTFLLSILQKLNFSSLVSQNSSKN